MITKLSPSFSLQEFACHSGEAVPHELVPNVADLVIGVLQPLRDKWGALIVLSGYRSPAYNRKIGGALKSTHMTAMAADIRPIKLADVNELAAVVEEMLNAGKLPALGGYGKYVSWLHLDIRHASDGHLRRWFGAGIGSEQDT